MSRKRIEKNLAYDDEKKLYYAYFDYGKDGNGARVRRTQTFDERDRAKEALYRFEVENLQHRRATPTQMTVKDWLTYWLNEVIQPNRERTTCYGYKSIIKNHLIPELGTVRLQQLTPKQIQSYYTKMMRNKQLSPNTVHKHHILLHTAMQTAFRQNLLTENPVDRVGPPIYRHRSSSTIIHSSSVGFSSLWRGAGWRRSSSWRATLAFAGAKSAV